MKDNAFLTKTILPVRFIRFGAYLPDRIIGNDEIVRSMGSEIPGSALQRAVGAIERRAAGPREMGSDMLAKLGRKILKESGVDPGSIDKLICSCDPSDQAGPDTAVVTQAKMGLTCPAFGVSMSCVGWICGVGVASQFLFNGDRRILVLAASTVGSKYYFNNPMHRAIFGDGAGGALLERDELNGQIIRTDLLTLGKFYKEIFAPNPWTTMPQEIPEQHGKFFHMASDNGVFYKALDKYLYPFYKKQFDITRLSENDISLFIFHQASMPLFNYTVESFGIPRDKVVDSFSRYGNTISAELPILITQQLQENRISKGDIVYLLTYGAGFTIGAMIIRI